MARNLKILDSRIIIECFEMVHKGVELVLRREFFNDLILLKIWLFLRTIAQGFFKDSWIWAQRLRISFFLV